MKYYYSTDVGNEQTMPYWVSELWSKQNSVKQLVEYYQCKGKRDKLRRSSLYLGIGFFSFLLLTVSTFAYHRHWVVKLIPLALTCWYAFRDCQIPSRIASIRSPNWDQYCKDLSDLVELFEISDFRNFRYSDSLRQYVGDRLTRAAIQIDAKRGLKLMLDAESEFETFKKMHKIAVRFGLGQPDRGSYFPSKKG